MGQLIDFAGKTPKLRQVREYNNDILQLLPKLRFIKGETVVICLNAFVIADDKILSNLIREIIALKCYDASVVLVVDTNQITGDFCAENFNQSNPFANGSFFEVNEQIDVFNIIVKQNIMKKIANIIKSFNATPVVCSGADIDIVFSDSTIGKTTIFDTQLRKINNGYKPQEMKKYSIKTLEELLKTNLIPIISPTFNDKMGNTYICESNIFSSYISSYLASLKFVNTYIQENDIPYGCVYGIERFSKIMKSGNFSQESNQIVNAGIEAVKNGTQCSHIINPREISLLEEFCSGSFNGLFLYDDTLTTL